MAPQCGFTTSWRKEKNQAYNQGDRFEDTKLLKKYKGTDADELRNCPYDGVTRKMGIDNMKTLIRLIMEEPTKLNCIDRPQHVLDRVSTGLKRCGSKCYLDKPEAHVSSSKLNNRIYRTVDTLYRKEALRSFIRRVVEESLQINDDGSVGHWNFNFNVFSNALDELMKNGKIKKHRFVDQLASWKKITWLEWVGATQGEVSMASMNNGFHIPKLYEVSFDPERDYSLAEQIWDFRGTKWLWNEVEEGDNDEGDDDNEDEDPEEIKTTEESDDDNEDEDPEEVKKTAEASDDDNEDEDPEEVQTTEESDDDNEDEDPEEVKTTEESDDDDEDEDPEEVNFTLDSYWDRMDAYMEFIDDHRGTEKENMSYKDWLDMPGNRTYYLLTDWNQIANQIDSRVRYLPSAYLTSARETFIL